VTAAESQRKCVLAAFDGIAVLPCGPQWFLWQLLGAERLGAGLHRFAPGWTESLGRLAASARAHPISLLCALVAVSALGLCPAALAYSPWEWTSYGPFSFQVSRALHYRFILRPVARWRLWPRPRAARQRRCSGAELGLLACRFGPGLCAVGAADIADGGWRPSAAPRADYRGARFRPGLRVRLLRPDGAVLRFAPNGGEFSTVFRSMPTACISCTTSLSSGCNTRCCPRGLFAIGKAAIVFGGTLALTWAAAVAFANASWVNHLVAQAKRWRARASA